LVKQGECGDEWPIEKHLGRQLRDDVVENLRARRGELAVCEPRWFNSHETMAIDQIKLGKFQTRYRKLLQVGVASWRNGGPLEIEFDVERTEVGVRSVAGEKPGFTASASGREFDESARAGVVIELLQVRKGGYVRRQRLDPRSIHPFDPEPLRRTTQKIDALAQQSRFSNRELCAKGGRLRIKDKAMRRAFNSGLKISRCLDPEAQAKRFVLDMERPLVGDRIKKSHDRRIACLSGRDLELVGQAAVSFAASTGVSIEPRHLRCVDGFNGARHCAFEALGFLDRRDVTARAEIGAAARFKGGVVEA